MWINKVASFCLVILPAIVPSQWTQGEGDKSFVRKPMKKESNTTLLTTSDYSNNEMDVDEMVVINNDTDTFRSLLLGDWSTCSTSSQCTNGCCSGKYSNGVLKCTPLASGFNPLANGCVSSPGGGGGGGGGGTNNWLTAHNNRRQKYHALYGKSYVPLKWSQSLANGAQSYANYLASRGCGLEHSKSGWGENLALNTGSSAASEDSILQRWVENEDPARYGRYVFENSGHFSQAIWRGTKYLGCGSASRSNCFIQVCRYAAPGNCGIVGQENRWASLVFADSSRCPPQCPPEGCF
jgi:hypothetical protein